MIIILKCLKKLWMKPVKINNINSKILIIDIQ